MKKNNGLMILLGMIAILCAIGAMLFPLGAGFVTTEKEAIVGYDFVFGNSASLVNPALNGPYPGLITAFVLGCVGGAFELIAFIFSFSQGGKKFAGFMDVLTGICFAVTALLFFLAKNLIGGYKLANYCTLGWGFILAGAFAAGAAVLALVAGVIGMKSKEN
jgi:hypothetical protein